MKKCFLLVLFLIGICLSVSAQEVAVFPQMGHTARITSVAFSPDGKHILSCGDTTIKLWDINSGREIKTFYGHTGRVNCVVFSPDGSQILSGSGYGDGDTIKIWDTASGRVIKSLSSNDITSVAFSPDGKQILSGSLDNTMGLWDASSGHLIHTFYGHTDRVLTVLFSPDSRYYLSSSADETIKLWDAVSRQEIKTFPGTRTWSDAVAFSPDSKQIIAKSGDNTLILWDITTGNALRIFTGYYFCSVEFSPDGTKILSGTSSGYNGIINLWDIRTGQEIKRFTFISDQTGDFIHNTVNTVKFNSDGKYFLSGSTKIRLWEIETGNEVRTFSGYVKTSSSIAVSPDSRQILSGYMGSSIDSWDILNGRKIIDFFGHVDTFSVAYSPNGQYTVSGYSGIKLWDATNGIEIKAFYRNEGQVFSAVFNRDGSQIISSDPQGISIWDIASGSEIKTIPTVGRNISSVNFSSDGSQAFFGYYDGIIKSWDILNDKEIKTFYGHTAHVAYIINSPDKRYILSSSIYEDRTIRLWDVFTGQEVRSFLHTNRVTSIAFSHNGTQILAGFSDGKIRLWDTESGREIRPFTGHFGSISSVSFTQDGKQIISGSSDGTIRLWDTSTGREIAQFISFIDGEWIVITPDGYYNASPNGDSYLNFRVSNNVYGIDQYRNTFYNPQIVEARLQGRPDPVPNLPPIQQAGEPPRIDIRSPVNGAILTTNRVELSVVIESKQPIKNIKFLVNGRLLSGDAVRGMRGVRGVELEGTGAIITGNQNKLEFNLNIQLDPGNNRIEVVANNPQEGRNSVEVFSQQASMQNTMPNLWILSIGVNRYNSPLLDDLRYAVNDAREIINIFTAQQGRVYGRVYSRLIADGTEYSPTKVNIQDGFDFLKSAGQNDIIMLFIAGHGLNDQNGVFYFMPSDAAFADNGSIRSANAISQSDIQTVLNIPGRKILFIDACHSAGAGNGITNQVNNEQLSRRLGSEGTVIFTSSKGNQFSQEHSDLRHGVFSYAIIQGMKGEANSGNGNITILPLISYVIRKVKELTNNAQEPVIPRLEGITDFDVAKTR